MLYAVQDFTFSNVPDFKAPLGRAIVRTHSEQSSVRRNIGIGVSLSSNLEPRDAAHGFRVPNEHVSVAVNRHNTFVAWQEAHGANDIGMPGQRGEQFHFD